jgi:hypothetical protein
MQFGGSALYYASTHLDSFDLQRVTDILQIGGLEAVRHEPPKTPSPVSPHGEDPQGPQMAQDPATWLRGGYYRAAKPRWEELSLPERRQKCREFNSMIQRSYVWGSIQARNEPYGQISEAWSPSKGPLTPLQKYTPSVFIESLSESSSSAFDQVRREKRPRSPEAPEPTDD